MSYYPETFDPNGPDSLAGSYGYLSWAAVSIHRALAEQPETNWELLPGLLGQEWGDPDWYQRNEWLADFYNNVYHYASSVDPVQFFAVDELGEPAAELARVIDSVVQGWTAAAYRTEEDPTDDEDGQWPTYGHDDYAAVTETHHPVGGYEYETPREYPSGAGSDPEHDPMLVDGLDQDDPMLVDGLDQGDPMLVDGQEQEPLADLDPEVARRALARVLDDEMDDLSSEEERILATVLTVERYQYLAREFELI